jgi:hypothetical protein
MKGALVAAVFVSAAVVLAPAAQADPDTDFANELHSFGVYGPRDYNAWIGKIACKRMYDGLDGDAYKSAHFISLQLPKGSTTAQAWQFLGSSINFYCPDKLPVLQAAAVPQS